MSFFCYNIVANQIPYLFQCFFIIYSCIGCFLHVLVVSRAFPSPKWFSIFLTLLIFSSLCYWLSASIVLWSLGLSLAGRGVCRVVQSLHSCCVVVVFAFWLILGPCGPLLLGSKEMALVLAVLASLTVPSRIAILLVVIGAVAMLFLSPWWFPGIVYDVRSWSNKICSSILYYLHVQVRHGFSRSFCCSHYYCEVGWDQLFGLVSIIPMVHFGQRQVGVYHWEMLGCRFEGS